MTLLASLLALASQDISGATLTIAYGRWIVDCTQTSVDGDGRVQCSAAATIEDLEIYAKRDGDQVRLHVTSPKCPGLVADGQLPVSLFRKQNRRSPLAISGTSTVLAAALGFKTGACGIPATEINGDQPNMDRAFEAVLSRRKPKK